jgi:hypothetical protein
MIDQNEIIHLGIEAGGFYENRPLIERSYFVFPCDEDLMAFVHLILKNQKWKDLSTAETKVLWTMTQKPSEYAKVISAKLKEKNFDDIRIIDNQRNSIKDAGSNS